MEAHMGKSTVQVQEMPKLEREAKKADSDPCDIACKAMAEHVAGDLCAKDEHWLHEHTDECDYCANELRRYDTLDKALTACGEICADIHEPPPLALPKRDRVLYTRMPSPVGDLILAATRDGLREIDFARDLSDAAFVMRLRGSGADPMRLERTPDAEPEARQNLKRAAAELQEYFNGRRAQFDVPLDWGGMPPFRRAVLEATAAVPFGHLDTYAGIAKRIGQPKATRAVGNALGHNPIPVIVPCHRVIRSDASIGGYTGGLDIKERLLQLEGVTLP
jgi:methylated-DNA-[protein]-cysteine S-methyltransferase